jgi:hypothetical protein
MASDKSHYVSPASSVPFESKSKRSEPEILLISVSCSVETSVLSLLSEGIYYSLPLTYLHRVEVQRHAVKPIAAWKRGPIDEMQRGGH